ncbi:hypothetical protein [Brevundimonas sp. CEF1]|uniref:hypothetical protein n=1 Tax=Brevundimonas sp. CEF1 TaxID=3442642 RepID=UPI003F50E6DB
MSQDFEEHDEDGGGFDVDDWARLKPFIGSVATLEDVQARRAIFALGDTEDGETIDMDLPQPAIWWEDDGEQAAVIVQAEAHIGSDGETMEVLGLILPDGSGAVALMDDVDLVDDTDPTWRDLVANAINDFDDDSEE